MLRTDDFSPDQEIAPIIVHDDDDHDEFGKYCVLDIFTAASIGDTAFVKQLLTRGTDANKVNVSGWTALMYAANIGHSGTCKMLIDCNAMVDAQTKRGQTPLMLAAWCGNDNVCNLLLQYSANLHVADNRGWTALFYATNYNHVHVVKQLLRAGADPNHPREPEGETPFLLACSEGNEQMVQTYLEFGADINYKMKNGVNAKELAFCNNHTKVSQLLENHRQAAATKNQHRQLQKTNSNPSKNPSIVDGHIGFQKFLEANPNFFDPLPKSKQTASNILFDKDKTLTPQSSSMNARPKSLLELLDQLQLNKYYSNFEQNEIDLNTFLQMTDTDLKEIGIKLLGPRKKMTNTIGRWHQQAPVFSHDLAEAAYANYHRSISDELRRKNDELNTELTAAQELVEKYKHDAQNVEMKFSNLQVSGKLCLTYVRECKKHAQLILERSNGDGKSVEYNSSRIRALCDQILLKFAESGLI